MTPEEQNDRAEWRTTRIEAKIWWCGDDCNCHQPQIDRIEPGDSFPWIKRTRLWTGTFHSDPDEDELHSMKEELRLAALQWNISL